MLQYEVMKFEEEYLVSISSIVPVKSNQFNGYLDLIASCRPAQVWLEEAVCKPGNWSWTESGEILQLPAPALEEEVRHSDDINNDIVTL